MKILITGAAGFVGCRATRFLGLSHQVIPLNSKQLDVTDEEMIHTLFMDHAPKAVIHMAALSDTAYCEAHPDDCEAVNYIGTLNVARAAAAVGAKLIYASSDQVYNGCTETGLLGEDVPLAPKGVYAALKYRTECEVQELLPTAVALRFSWMYDVPNSPLRQNHGLLLRLLEAAPSTNVAASRMFGKSCAASKPPSPCPVEFTTLVRPTVAPLTTPCSKPRAFWPLPGIWKPGVPRPSMPSKRRNATWP